MCHGDSIGQNASLGTLSTTVKSRSVGQLDEQLDDADEALEVLDHLEAGRDAVARVAERGAHRGEPVVAREVGLDRHGLAGRDLARGLRERVRGGIDEHRALRALAARARAAAATPAPQPRSSQAGALRTSGAASAVAHLVLDPDRRRGLARDAFLPFGMARAAYTQPA